MNHLFESGVYSIYKWNIFQPLQKKQFYVCINIDELDRYYAK